MSRTAYCCCSRCSIEVDGDPVLSGVCDCDECKKRTGSAFGFSAYFPTKEVILIQGNYKSYCVDAETGKQERYFCQHCGSTLYWTPQIIENCVGVAGGCFTDTPLPESGFVSLADRQCGWLSLSSGIKRGLTAADIPKIDA